MIKTILRALPVGAFLFLVLACTLSTPVPVETPEPGLQLDTPTASAVILVPPTVSPEFLVTPSPGEPLPASWVYAVVLVPEGGVLEAHAGAGYDSPVVGTVPWDLALLISTGNVAQIGLKTWVEAYMPEGGTGWFDRYYLTSLLPSEEFCSMFDEEELFGRLYEALRTNDGRLLAPLVSPVHGLTITYINNGNPRLYSPTDAVSIFGSSEVIDWGLGPGSGLPVQGTFEDLVRPDLLAVFGDSYQTNCNLIKLGGASYTVTWPSIWKNINFYSVHKPGSPGIELDWMTWLVGVEGAEGKNYLFSLSRFNWEP